MSQSHTAVRGDQVRPAARQPDRTERPVNKAAGLESVTSRKGKRAVTVRRVTVASAALLLAGGYVHFCLYRHGYRFIPKIGISFLFQAGSSAVLAAALLVRGRPIRIGRRAVALAQLVRLSAIGLSLGTLAALGIAHTPGGLFQFHEIGLRPAPQTLIAIVAETLAAILLTVAIVEARPNRIDHMVGATSASPAANSARRAA